MLTEGLYCVYKVNKGGGKNMKRHPIMEYVIPAIVASVATVLIRLVLGW